MSQNRRQFWFLAEERECGYWISDMNQRERGGNSESALRRVHSTSTPFSSAIFIEPMLTMFADILYLTHHLLHKLFYKQIIATAACSRVFQLLGRVALVIYPMSTTTMPSDRYHQITKVIKIKMHLVILADFFNGTRQESVTVFFLNKKFLVKNVTWENCYYFFLK